MGWLYLYECDTKASIREHIIREMTSDDERVARRVLKHRTVGNHLWLAYEAIPKAPEHKPVRAIILCLLAKSDENWGYKDMDESMEPYYYDCPESLLKLFPAPDERAAAWRAKVAEYHKAKRTKRELFKRIKVGSVVELKGRRPDRFRVANLAPFRGYAVDTGAGPYRLRKTWVTAVEPDPIKWVKPA